MAASSDDWTGNSWSGTDAWAGGAPGGGDRWGSSMPTHSVITRPNGTIGVEWSECALEDEELMRFNNERLPALLAKLPATSVEATVNLSGNKLSGPEPIRKLLRCLREASVHVTVLRLHKNRLTDDAAYALAEHIVGAVALKKPLMQLHLSNNALTEAGIRHLVETTFNCGGYPRPPGGQPLPSLGNNDCHRRSLWLRTEQQQPPIQDPKMFIRNLEVDGYEVTFVNSSDPRFPSETVVHMHPSFLGPFNGKGKDGHSGYGYHDMKGDHKGKGKFGEPKGKFGEPKGKFGEPKGKRFEAKGEGKGFPSSKGGGRMDDASDKGRPAAHAEEPDDHKWLKSMRDGHPGVEELWRRWCQTNITQAMPKEQRLKVVLDFVQYYRYGAGVSDLAAAMRVSGQAEDWGAGLRPSAGGQSTAPPPPAPPATATPRSPPVSGPAATPSGSPDAGSTQPSFCASWRAWLLRGSTVLPQLRKAAMAGALQKSLQPSAAASSEWQRLVYAGNQALKSGSGRKAFDAGASFLSEEALQELSEAAFSKPTLNAIASDLNLMQLLEPNCEQAEGSGVFLALYGELQEKVPGEAEGITAAKQSAAKALLDYAFMAGMAQVAGGGAGSCVGAQGTQVPAAMPGPAPGASPAVDSTIRAPPVAGAAAVSAAAAAAAAVAEEEEDDEELHLSGGAAGGAFDLSSLAASFGLSFDTAGKGASASSAAPPGQSGQAERHFGAAGPGGDPPQPGHPAYKKKQCVFWEQGRCTKMENCTFAHGEADLAPSRGGAERSVPVPHFGPSWEVGPSS